MRIGGSVSANRFGKAFCHHRHCNGAERSTDMLADAIARILDLINAAVPQVAIDAILALLG